MKFVKLTDFDRIQLLALDQRRNDWRRIDREFAKYNGKVEKYIVGKGEILDENIYDMIDGPPLKESWNGHTSNAFYCYQAHRKILERAITEGVQNLLLLEDDVQLLDNFEINMEILEKSGITWDMYYGGFNLEWGEATEVTKDVLRFNKGVYCWHCIGIKRHMFQTLLDLPAVGPFDFLTAQFIQPDRAFNCIGVWPVSAIQKPTFSYVNGAFQDYTGYFNNKKNVKQEYKN